MFVYGTVETKTGSVVIRFVAEKFYCQGLTRYTKKKDKRLNTQLHTK